MAPRLIATVDRPSSQVAGAGSIREDRIRRPNGDLTRHRTPLVHPDREFLSLFKG